MLKFLQTLNGVCGNYIKTTPVTQVAKGAVCKTVIIGSIPIQVSIIWPIRKAANSPACHAGDDRGSTGIGRTTRGGAVAA